MYSISCWLHRGYSAEFLHILHSNQESNPGRNAWGADVLTIRLSKHQACLYLSWINLHWLGPSLSPTPNGFHPHPLQFLSTSLRTHLFFPGYSKAMEKASHYANCLFSLTKEYTCPPISDQRMQFPSSDSDSWQMAKSVVFLREL